jgi:hypothetical protein
MGAVVFHPILFLRQKVHKNCAICASPTQRERFHLAGSLFHTLFNRTVENFHTTFTFSFIFDWSLVRKLHCDFLGCSPRNLNFFSADFIFARTTAAGPEFVSLARVMIRFCGA